MGFFRIIYMVKNVQNWAEYIQYKFRGRKNDTFTFKLRNGLQVIVPKKIQPEFKENVFDEMYFKHLPKSIINQGHPVIIDIGANVGFFSIFAFLKCPQAKIIAFEPIQRNFIELQKNTSQIPTKILTIVNKAVSSSVEQIVLKFDKNQSITTSASIFNNVYGNDEERVLSTTLEKIMSEFELPTIDILKLDCEGAEYEIIYKTPTPIFKRIKSICLETHQGPKNDENCFALANYLKELGYKIVLKPHHYIWAFQC